MVRFQINIIIKSLFITFWMLPFSAIAQDLEPRFLSSMPLSGFIYGYSYGNILLNAQEIEGLNAKLNKLGSLKFSVTNGLYIDSGANFTSALLDYSFLWFDKMKPSVH